MNRIIVFTMCLALPALQPRAQQSRLIVAGPMQVHTELRTAGIWAQFAPEIKAASVIFREAGAGRGRQRVQPVSLSGGAFNTGTAVLTALEPGTTYQYYLSAAGKTLDSGRLTTQSLWQWRTPAPDFSFIAGSCAYTNDAVYDRPGKSYAQDSSIFRTMASEKAAFMLWLGDNWYTREVDYFSEWGLFDRAAHARRAPVLRALLKAMPHYAIWDDHDYGPNDDDKSYPLKHTSRQVFMNYWGNPSYGDGGQGIYTKLSWNDVDLFLLDDRWFRSNDRMKDSVNGAPNPGKKMFGPEQLEWLKNALLHSMQNRSTSFRLIVTGSQVLNPLSNGDSFVQFPAEYRELMDFLLQNRIDNVVFLTGDRHRSEVIRTQRPGAYPLYDITVSPLTAGSATSYGRELNNPHRVMEEVTVQNYGRLTVSGPAEDRRLTLEIVGLDGKTLRTWSVAAKETAFPQ